MGASIAKKHFKGENPDYRQRAWIDAL